MSAQKTGSPFRNVLKHIFCYPQFVSFLRVSAPVSCSVTSIALHPFSVHLPLFDTIVWCLCCHEHRENMKIRLPYTLPMWIYKSKMFLQLGRPVPIRWCTSERSRLKTMILWRRLQRYAEYVFVLAKNASYASFVRTVVFIGFLLLYSNEKKKPKRRHNIFILRKVDIKRFSYPVITLFTKVLRPALKLLAAAHNDEENSKVNQNASRKNVTLERLLKYCSLSLCALWQPCVRGHQRRHQTFEWNGAHLDIASIPSTGLSIKISRLTIVMRHI